MSVSFKRANASDPPKAWIEGDLRQEDVEALPSDGAFELVLSEEHGWSGHGLELVEQLPRLDALILSSFSPVDISALSMLPNLTRLGLSGKLKGTVDLSTFSQLSDLALYVDEKRLSIKALGSLKDLACFSGRASLRLQEEIASLENLRKVVLVNSQVADLDFLKPHTELLGLEINVARKLTRIDGIEGSLKLQFLKFTNAKKIEQYHALNSLFNLRCLSFFDCAPLETIKFVEQFQKLSCLYVLGDTVVLDGVISVIEHCPVLDVQIVDKPHYDRSNAELPKNPDHKIKMFKRFERGMFD